MNLSTNGLLNGTPDTPGPFNFTILATNAYGWSNRVFDVSISQVPAFSTTNPLPAGKIGEAYSLQIVASGSPIFSVTAGSLPGGLNLSTNGLLDGTPNAAGPFNFTVMATNAYGWSDRAYDLTISNFLSPSFTFIRVTNSNVSLAWTNPNAAGNIQVWRAVSITNQPVTWSNLGAQVSPWTNTSPTNPSYYRLRIVP